MKRRDVLRSLAAGSVAAGAGLVQGREVLAQVATPPAPRGLPPIRIRDVQVILTAPDNIRLVVVKVLTDQPGLHGWGCATFTQRALVVKTAVDEYLRPFLIGRRVDEIEDIWQSMYMSSYWRNGPVLFNAMSGVDIALWDILGKRAGLPLINSTAGLKALQSGKWPRRLPVALVADIDGEWVCCRAADAVCPDCGYGACTEIAEARRLRPSAVLGMVRYV